MASYVVTVYRVTNAGDLITNVPSNELINFNSSKSTRTENAFIFPDGLKIIPTEGIGDNQSAETEFGNQQALGRVEKFYELRGFISLVEGTSADGDNLFVRVMEKWESGDKQNSAFSNGIASKM